MALICNGQCETNTFTDGATELYYTCIALHWAEQVSTFHFQAKNVIKLIADDAFTRVYFSVKICQPP